MFPFSFEWVWEMGRVVFMGGLGYALTVIGLGMAYCIIKSVIDTVQGHRPGDNGHNEH